MSLQQVPPTPTAAQRAQMLEAAEMLGKSKCQMAWDLLARYAGVLVIFIDVDGAAGEAGSGAGLHVGLQLIPDLAMDDSGFSGTFGFDTGAPQRHVRVPWNQVLGFSLPLQWPPVKGEGVNFELARFPVILDRAGGAGVEPPQRPRLGLVPKAEAEVEGLCKEPSR